MSTILGAWNRKLIFSVSSSFCVFSRGLSYTLWSLYIKSSFIFSSSYTYSHWSNLSGYLHGRVNCDNSALHRGDTINRLLGRRIETTHDGSPSDRDVADKRCRNGAVGCSGVTRGARAPCYIQFHGTTRILSWYTIRDDLRYLRVQVLNLFLQMSTYTGI